MKLKTSKSAAKRILKVTRRGKILRKGMSAQHRMKGKSKRSKRRAGLNFDIAKANARKIKRLIPYR